ncbi:hypothetical protein [Heyndrickxia acidicola]|uniref:Uncharacterized protein n=1 Tax=Heyndrickxia acidicola TaxID=209389 RepID=A0ABU6MB33_9BACI|nr:hypothetical protein [Heyndrickxia acidicola]MED1201895.1 hypothetical protein [Heyndrickxia acidicola]
MNLRVGQKYKINNEQTIQITKTDYKYVYFAEYINGKYTTSRNMKKENFNIDATQLLSGILFVEGV